MNSHAALIKAAENFPWAIFLNLIIGFSSYYAGFVDR